MMKFDDRLKQLEEKKQILYEEIDFFNHNIAWWSNEINRLSKQYSEHEKNFFSGISSSELDNLIASMKYLMSKAQIEQKAAEVIDRKLYNLGLEEQLLFIQGDFNLPDDNHIKKSIQAKKKLKKKIKKL